MFQLSVGDKIYIQNDKNVWEITRIEKQSHGNPSMYQIEKRQYGRTYSKWVWESEIEAISDLAPEKKSNSCECGISKTYGEKANAWFHSIWCPLYIKGEHE